MNFIIDWFFSLSIYQWLTPCFAALMIFSLLSRKMRRNISTGNFLIGSFIWVGAAAISLFPDVILESMLFLGIKEGVRAAIFFGFLVLAFTCYKLILHTDMLEREVTLLTREFAMRDLERTAINPSTQNTCSISVPVGNVKISGNQESTQGCGNKNCGCKERRAKLAADAKEAQVATKS